MDLRLLRTRRIKAVRRERPCMWCAEVIVSGSSAVNEAVVFEGEFRSEYYHEECVAARDRTVKRIKDDLEWSPGDYPRGGDESYEDQWEREEMERRRADCELNTEVFPVELRVIWP